MSGLDGASPDELRDVALDAAARFDQWESVRDLLLAECPAEHRAELLAGFAAARAAAADLIAELSAE